MLWVILTRYHSLRYKKRIPSTRFIDNQYLIYQPGIKRMKSIISKKKRNIRFLLKTVQVYHQKNQSIALKLCNSFTSTF